MPRQRNSCHISDLAVQGDNWKTMLPLMLLFALLFFIAAIISVAVFLIFKKEQPIEKVFDEDNDGENKKTLDKPPEEYQKFALDEHNRIRANHHAGDLALRPFLMKKSQKCAEYYLQRGSPDHTCPYKNNPKLLGTFYGENLYMTNRTGDPLHFTKVALAGWYQESEDYDFDNGTSKTEGARVSHFTQMVWKTSRELGVGFKERDSKVVLVCLYNPLGNINGKYEKNVFKAE